MGIAELPSLEGCRVRRYSKPDDHDHHSLMGSPRCSEESIAQIAEVSPPTVTGAAGERGTRTTGSSGTSTTGPEVVHQKPHR